MSETHAQDELIAHEWQTLIELDDRTSPVEYPDMALITHDELAAIIRRAALQADPEYLSGQEAVALSKRVWDELDRLIEDSPNDGISADGTYKVNVAIEQGKYIDGIRAARLRVRSVLATPDLKAGKAAARNEAPSFTLRVCVSRDAICPHGLSCPYWRENADCDMDASRAAHNPGAPK